MRSPPSYQFTLKALFVVVTLVALVCSFISVVVLIVNSEDVEHIASALITIAFYLWLLIASFAIGFARGKRKSKPVVAELVIKCESDESGIWGQAVNNE